MSETTKSSHGGRRPGAGRKPGQGPYGEATVAMRIPISQAEALRNWLLARKAAKNQFPPKPGELLEWLGPAQMATEPVKRPLFLSRKVNEDARYDEELSEKSVDLNEYLIKHPGDTFFLKVKGHSMTGAGIFDNDLVVVDRSLAVDDGSIVIAVLDGELIVKRLALLPDGAVELHPENPRFSAIRFDANQDLEIWGVVTDVIHSLIVKPKD